MYVIQALWNASKYNLPVVYLIVNNTSYMILKGGLRRLNGPARAAGVYPGILPLSPLPPRDPDKPATQRRRTLLIPYRKAQREMGDVPMTAELVETLSQYDIYDGISLSRHAETLQASWHRFGQRQRESTSASYVFDCCFL